MTTVDGIAAVVFFFGIAVLAAAIPGMLIGLVIGRSVPMRALSFVLCVAVDVLVPVLIIQKWATNSGSSEHTVWIAGVSIALLFPTMLGWWFTGRKDKI